MLEYTHLIVLDIKSTLFHSSDARAHDPPFIEYDGAPSARSLAPVDRPRNLRPFPTFEIPDPHRTVDTKTDTPAVR